MKKKGRYQISLTFGILYLLILLPCAGYGADLSIGNTVSTTGNWTVNGTVAATSFSGDGSNLSNVTAARWKVASVAVVAKSGGDYADPVTAMAKLGDWCGTPSATNPCLMRIMPGVYDVGTNSVVMQSYVDIEGSGENTTVITGHIDSESSGVVLGASYAEIRFVTVQNTGGGGGAIAIYNSSASPKITHVTAEASGASSNCGVFNISSSSPTMTNVTASGAGGTSENCGVHNHSSSSPMMVNVTASAAGGTGSTNAGIVNCSSSPTMTNVTASASGGTNSYGVFSDSGGTVRINHSVITGLTSTLVNGSGVTTYVGYTQLVGGAVSGTLTCVGAYDANYNALSTSCSH